MTAPSGHARAVRTRQLGLVVAILLVASWVASAFLIPIAWAAILGIVEWPLYRRATLRFPGHAAWIAVAFAFATALVLLIPLSLAAVSMARESQAALDWLREAQRAGIRPPPWLPALPFVGLRAAAWWQDHVGTPEAANALLGSVSAASIFDWTRSISLEVARELGLFLVTLIALVSFLSHGQRIRDDAAAAAVQTFGPFGGEFLERMIAAVRGTVSGTLIVSFGEGAIIGVGYVLAGVPQPLLFTVFTMLLALVPFGAWLAFGIASLLVIGDGHGLSGALLFAFGATVMTVGDNVVQPAVIGSSVELPFLLALIGAFGGLAEMGLVGLFIGPVIMVALLLVWREWIRPGVEQEES
jgi:predicted PurR-regulated permease PerM